MMTPRLARWLGRVLASSLTPDDGALAADAVRTYEARLAQAHDRGGVTGLLVTFALEIMDAMRLQLTRRGRRREVLTRHGVRPRSPNRRISRMTDDIRHAARRLRSRPATTLGAVLMLGLAVGMTTAMFTIVDALLLRPVPFRNPDDLARLWMAGPRGGRLAVSPAVLDAWRRSGLFEAVEGATTGSVTLHASSGDTVHGTARVGAGLFQMLGVEPLRGRSFTADEGRAGTDDRVLLSEDLWRSRFGGDPSLIGQSIVLDGTRAVVVGIMPADFRFPRSNTAVWRPIDYEAPSPALSGELPIAHVRFRPGISESDVLAAATRLAVAADPAVSRLDARRSPLVSATIDAYYQTALPLLSAGVGLVFLVLSANVCGLLLGRLSARRREYGTCSALGASRVRLVREAAIEHAALGLLGALAGLAIAAAFVSFFRGVLPEPLLTRTLNPVNLDGRALAMASVAGLVAALVAGLLPAWIGTRVDPLASLRSAGRAGSESRATRRTTRVLLTAEIALACTLLVSATLLARSFIAIATADRGLRTGGVVVTWISVPRSTPALPGGHAAIVRSVEQSLRSLPGVEQTVMSFGAPPDGGNIHFGNWQSDVPGSAPVDMEVESYAVPPAFFDLYEIPLRRGRPFRETDDEASVIVGERFAARLWPGIDPIGRHFTYDGRAHTVVGLAREIELPSIDETANRPEFYRPFAGPGAQVWISMACSGGCPAEPVIRQRVSATHASVRVQSVQRLDAVYAEQIARPRAAAVTAVVFAAVALLASAAGLFSVLAAGVGRRQREFGIRAALGANASQLGRSVIVDGIRMTVAGLALGAAGAWAASRGLASLFYGVTLRDPLTWIFVLATVAVAVGLASWRPSRRARLVDPAMLLRDE